MLKTVVLLFLVTLLSLKGDDVYLSDNLDLNGTTLTINGNLYHSNGILKVNNGRLIVKGDYKLTGHSKLYMQKSNDHILVEGDFIMDSSSSQDYLVDGVLEVKGNFTQLSSSGTGQSDANFIPKLNHKVLLSGDTKQFVSFAVPNISSFNILEIANTSVQGIEFETVAKVVKELKPTTTPPIINSKNIILYQTATVDGGVWAYDFTFNYLRLQEDLIVEQNVYLTSGQLDLNGTTLTINGNLYHSNGILKVNNGRLIVKGDYKLTGYSQLYMQKSSDNIIVEGNFTMDSSGRRPSYLTDGVLEVKGNFTQLSSYGTGQSKTNFRPELNHKVLLSGDAKQFVSFAEPDSSFFNILEIANTSVQGIEFETVGIKIENIIASNCQKPLVLDNLIILGDENLSSSCEDLYMYLNHDILIQKMDLTANKELPLSRSDAIVLVDRMLILNGSTEKDMRLYTNTFGDVSQEADYFESLKRLMYYQSSQFTVYPEAVNRTNSFFHPLHHMTREEFIKVALNAFNIPKQSVDLTPFNDEQNISTWAVEYFETAVYDGIIIGNENNLLAKNTITIKEALLILDRIRTQFSNAIYIDSNYLTPSISSSTYPLVQKLGLNPMPSNYNPDAIPIVINSNDVSASYDSVTNAFLLSANATADNDAIISYFWQSDKGYFKYKPTSSNYSQVYFYPATSEPLSDYTIKISVGDNFGFVDDTKITLSKDIFTYEEDSKSVDASHVSVSNEVLKAYTYLNAGVLFGIDFGDISIKKSELSLSLENISVVLRESGRVLFSGRAKDDKVYFMMPNLPEFFGEYLTLDVTIKTQTKKQNYTILRKYLPIFKLEGVVYYPQENNITINGKEVRLDEYNRFSYIFQNSSDTLNVSVDAKISGVDPIEVTLSKDVPIQYITINRDSISIISDDDGDGIPNDQDHNSDDGPLGDNDGDGTINIADNDDDNDGIVDSYELKYPEIMNPFVNDSANDSDSDGYSNLQEYQLGTNPNDSSDTPSLNNNLSPAIINYLLSLNASKERYYVA